MSTALRNFEDINLVYGHNDPMAYGAYLAAKDAGREKDILFVGVDALPNEGVKYVHDGVLAATFLYPTPGAEGLRQALKVLARREGREEARAPNRDRHQGERRRDPEAQRAPVSPK